MTENKLNTGERVIAALDQVEFFDFMHIKPEPLSLENVLAAGLTIHLLTEGPGKHQFEHDRFPICSYDVPKQSVYVTLSTPSAKKYSTFRLQETDNGTLKVTGYASHKKRSNLI